METKLFEILESGKARELNECGDCPLESEEMENYPAALQQWQEAEKNRVEYEIDYPKIKVGDFIWAENRFGKPTQLQVIKHQECDPEIHIRLEDVDQETNIIWLPGTIVEGTIIENKLRILKVIE